MATAFHGSSRQTRAYFYNSAGNLANPTTTTLKIRKPDGTESSVAQGSLTQESTGVWSYTVTLDQSGTWYFRWVGTGNVVAAYESRVEVVRTPFTTP